MSTYSKNHPESIQEMFGSIAKSYDRANAILSFQMHKHWNALLVKQVLGKNHPELILDLCCGTGDIAFNYLKKENTPTKAILLDFCPEMLAYARNKAQHFKLHRHAIEYLQADAQHIPLSDNLVPFATMAYGIRNIQDPLRSLKEVFRVLKPGGIFGVLELTQPKNKMIRIAHQFYLKRFLPILGKWVTSNPHAYRYLCESIQRFIPPEKIEYLFQEAGFKQTSRKSVTLGTATIILGRKES